MKQIKFADQLEIIINSIKLTEDPVEKLHTLYTLPVEALPLSGHDLTLLPRLKELGCFTVGDLFVKIPDVGHVLSLKERIREYIRRLEVFQKGDENVSS